MRGLTLVLVAAAGCSFQHGSSPSDAPGDPDAMPDGAPDAHLYLDAGPCFGTLASICLPMTPTNPTFGAGTVNSDTDARCSPMFTDWCVIAGTAMTFSNPLRFRGKRPVIIVAERTLTIAATLDVSSTRTPNFLGAGANWASCVPGTVPQTGDGGQAGGGGGAGGSFAGPGGAGGGGTQSQMARAGGTPGAMPSVDQLHGGCRGQAGAISNGSNGGAPGESGGALYLLAGQSITITSSGNLFAGGGGGGLAKPTGGGAGGGGSGGMIALEAPTITALGVIDANGGGGGGGAGSPGSPGVTNGTDARNVAYTIAAAGGTGASGAGGGGAGGAGAQLGGGTGIDGTSGGGGGGGGAAGVVWVKGALSGTNISPAPTLH